jgi:hypothetical protein
MVLFFPDYSTEWWSYIRDPHTHDKSDGASFLGQRSRYILHERVSWQHLRLTIFVLLLCARSSARPSMAMYCMQSMYSQ